MSSFVVSRMLPSGRRALSRFSPRTPSVAAASIGSPVPCDRLFSTEEAKRSNVDFSSPQVKKLYDEIVELPVEEINVLGALVIQMLGQKLYPGEFGRGGVVFDGAAGAAEEEQKVEEVKTIFDVKLVGFDAKAKIKVIKEVRAITGLGLKEAKELVESAPKVLSKGMKQEAADELKEKLEAVGAQVELV